jgi:hypothetical protein
MGRSSSLSQPGRRPRRATAGARPTRAARRGRRRARCRTPGSGRASRGGRSRKRGRYPAASDVIAHTSRKRAWRSTWSAGRLQGQPQRTTGPSPPAAPARTNSREQPHPRADPQGSRCALGKPEHPRQRQRHSRSMRVRSRRSAGCGAGGGVVVSCRAALYRPPASQRGAAGRLGLHAAVRSWNSGPLGLPPQAPAYTVPEARRRPTSPPRGPNRGRPTPCVHPAAGYKAGRAPFYAFVPSRSPVAVQEGSQPCLAAVPVIRSRSTSCRRIRPASRRAIRCS